MKKLIYVILWLTLPIFGQTIYIIPPWGYDKAPIKFFDTDDPYYAWHDVGVAFKKVVESLQTLGHTVILAKPYEEYPHADRIIYVDIWRGNRWQYAKTLKKYDAHKLILLTLEPSCVDPLNFDRSLQEFFGTIITWFDEYQDKKYVKFFYPKAHLTMLKSMPSFNQRKLCTLISAYKPPQNPCALYAERKNVVEFFEHQLSQDFDFYGGRKNNLWGVQYKNYKGPVPTLQPKDPAISATQIEYDKIHCLQQYRFCFTYENMSQKGYISEKIFDCFRAGCIPIYWGAENIKEYIPAACFIDVADFKNLNELYRYIKQMSEYRYNQYLENIRTYLESDQAALFSLENFVDTILNVITPGYDPTKVFSSYQLQMIEKKERWNKSYESRKGCMQ